MNYFPFHIGDYAAHTARLSLMEDLAYRRLIDAYYLTEKPLQGSPADVAREVGMLDNIKDIEYVLGKFFTLTDAGYTNSRCEEEIANFRDKREKASVAGKASAQRRLNGRSTRLQQESNVRCGDLPESSHDVEHVEKTALTSVDEIASSAADISTSVGKISTDEVPTKNQEPRTKNQKKNQSQKLCPPADDDPPEGEVVAGMDERAWDRYFAYRREIKKPIKPASMLAAKRGLAKFGRDQLAVVEQTIANGWQGLFDLKEPSVRATATDVCGISSKMFCN